MKFKDNPYIKLTSYTWKHLLSKHRSDQTIIYAVFILSVAIGSLNPILYKWVIDKIQANDLVLNSIWLYGVGCILLKLVEWGLYSPIYLKQRSLSFDLSAEYLITLNKKVMRFSAEWHQVSHSGATINRIKKSYEALKTFLIDDFIYLRIFFRVIFALTALIYFTPLYGFICLLFGIITIYLIAVLDKKFLLHLNKVNEKDHKMTSHITDNLINHKTLISLRLTNNISKKIKTKVDEIKPPFMDSFKIDVVKWTLVDVLIASIHATIAIGYVYQNYSSGKTFIIGGLVAVLAYSTQFTGAFHNLAWLYTKLTQTYSDFKSSDIILSTTEKKNNFSYHKKITEWKKIGFSNINYIHKSQDKNLKVGLHNINFELYKGQKIALIGESGSGKTTLLNLLGGLNEPYGSRIAFDNTNIQWDQFRELSTLWLQHPEIFNETLYYNLNMGQYHSDEQIKEACDLALLDTLLKKMPKGLMTNIDQAGSNLSGGERQLVSVARGILLSQDSQVLLFDEPTSNMDILTEERVMRNIFRHFKDRTVICSLHRYYLLHYFDYIYMMEKGKIVWHGSYEALKSEKIISRHFEESIQD